MFKFIKALYLKATKLAISIYQTVKTMLTEVHCTEVTVVEDTTIQEEVLEEQSTMTEEHAEQVASKIASIVGKTALVLLSVFVVNEFFYLILVSACVYYTYQALNYCVNQAGASLI
jgi:hypothetical protein